MDIRLLIFFQIPANLQKMTFIEYNMSQKLCLGRFESLKIKKILIFHFSAIHSAEQTFFTQITILLQNISQFMIKKK